MSRSRNIRRQILEILITCSPYAMEIDQLRTEVMGSAIRPPVLAEEFDDEHERLASSNDIEVVDMGQEPADNEEYWTVTGTGRTVHQQMKSR